MPQTEDPIGYVLGSDKIPCNPYYVERCIFVRPACTQYEDLVCQVSAIE